MPPQRSEWVRRDPARAAKFIIRYESDVKRALLKYLQEATREINKRFDVDLAPRNQGSPTTGIRNELDSIFIDELSGLLKGLATWYSPEFQSIVATDVKANYEQGVKVGVQQLQKAGMTGKIPKTLLAADWRALDIIQGRNLTALEGITEDINAAIVREVSEGLVKGENIRQVSDRLATLTDMAEDRAYRIARFETMFALNQGTIQRYYQNGVSEVEWITGGDDGHTCDECLDLDGQIFPIDNIPDCPLHVNCRCTLAPVISSMTSIANMVRQRSNQTAQAGAIAAIAARCALPFDYLHGPLSKCDCRAIAGGG
jgi:phage putative head morphogenesis protein, SPP1 gp7 family